MISPGHRRRLNGALHELRRPLQALALADDRVESTAASPAGAARRGLLELACAALAELDRAVNGGPIEHERRQVSCRELVLASLERCRPLSGEEGRIKVFWDAGPAIVEGDPVRMAQAFDNLIANALEHGGPPLVVTGAQVAGRLRVTFANGEGGSQGAKGALSDDPRRGHGVGLVSRVAAAHRGRFALCRTEAGCVAALELPLCDASLARAA